MNHPLPKRIGTKIIMSEQFSTACARCGLCCLTMTCVVGQWLFSTDGDTRPCPGLSFEEDVAKCAAYDYAIRRAGEEQAKSAMGIGVGCCIKAKGYMGEEETDYATYPPHKKRAYVRTLLDGRGIIAVRKREG